MWVYSHLSIRSRRLCCCCVRAVQQNIEWNIFALVAHRRAACTGNKKVNEIHAINFMLKSRGQINFYKCASEQTAVANVTFSSFPNEQISTQPVDCHWPMSAKNNGNTHLHRLRRISICIPVIR